MRLSLAPVLNALTRNRSNRLVSEASIDSCICIVNRMRRFQIHRTFRFAFVSKSSAMDSSTSGYLFKYLYHTATRAVDEFLLNWRFLVTFAKSIDNDGLMRLGRCFWTQMSMRMFRWTHRNSLDWRVFKLHWMAVAQPQTNRNKEKTTKNGLDNLSKTKKSKTNETELQTKIVNKNIRIALYSFC